jgi:hypothetical protein
MPMIYPRPMEPLTDGTIQIHIDIKLFRRDDIPVEKFTKIIPKYKFHDGDNLFISLNEFLIFLVNTFVPP